MLKITADQVHRISQFAETAYPSECCGVLIGHAQDSVKTAEELILARNQQTTNAGKRYLISPGLIQELERKLRGTPRLIVGVFHSHPDAPARPSVYDRESALPWWSYWIVPVRKGRSGEGLCWRLEEDRGAFEPEKFEILAPAKH